MRPSEGRISLWPAVVIGFVATMAALTVTPTMKLAIVPPPDFVGSSATTAPTKVSLASEYWQVVVGVIQWKYNRTAELPEQMPPEFRLVQGTGGGDQLDRATYWKAARKEWNKPENWHRSYQVDWSWMINDAHSLSQAVSHLIRDI